MSGIIIVGIGTGMTGLGCILFLAGIIYGRTAGKRIREELKREYE